MWAGGSSRLVSSVGKIWGCKVARPIALRWQLAAVVGRDGKYLRDGKLYVKYKQLRDKSGKLLQQATPESSRA